MADLKLGSQIGGNLIWHQGILDLNPVDDTLFYKNFDVITSKGGQTINGNLTVGPVISNGKVTAIGTDSSWGAVGDASFEADKSANSSATWLIASKSGSTVRAGIQVLNSAAGTTRIYTNSRSNYTEFAGGQVVIQASIPSRVDHATRKDYVDGEITRAMDYVDSTKNTINSTISTLDTRVTTLDAQNVKITGNQTIAGTKTFSSVVVLPTTAPTASTHAAHKGYVDSLNATSVKGVTATAPVQSSGGINPVISIVAATRTASGSMSSNDKIKLDDLPADALSRSGGTMNGYITLGGAYGINSDYGTGYTILRDFRNGNVTLSAAGADLYLGYQTSAANYTTANVILSQKMRWTNSSGNVIVDADGLIPWSTVKDNEGFVGKSKNLVGVTDFDSLTLSGFYNLYNSRTGSTNPPPFDYGTLVVVGSGNDGGKFVTQIATDKTSRATYIRTRNDVAQVWTGWSKQYSETSKPSLTELNAAPAGFGLGETTGFSLNAKSCNDATENGFYSIYATTTDVPPGVASGSALLTQSWSASAKTQICMSYTNDRVFTRRLYSGVWKPWVEVVTTASNGATMTGDLQITKEKAALILRGGGADVLENYGRIRFEHESGDQHVQILHSVHDGYRPGFGIRVMKGEGNASGLAAWIDVEGDAFATNFIQTTGQSTNGAASTRKDYVDGQIALQVAKTGDVMSGTLTATQFKSSGDYGFVRSTNTAQGMFVGADGRTIIGGGTGNVIIRPGGISIGTGEINFANNGTITVSTVGTATNHLITKGYVDGEVTSAATTAKTYTDTTTASTLTSAKSYTDTKVATLAGDVYSKSASDDRYPMKVGDTFTGTVTINPSSTGVADALRLIGTQSPTGTNARGISAYNPDGTARIWGAGMYSEDGTNQYAYFGEGTNPWTSGLKIFPTKADINKDLFVTRIIANTSGGNDTNPSFYANTTGNSYSSMYGRYAPYHANVENTGSQYAPIVSARYTHNAGWAGIYSIGVLNEATTSPGKLSIHHINSAGAQSYVWHFVGSNGTFETSNMIAAGNTQTNSLKVLSDAPTITMQDTNHMSGFIHVNSNNFYVLRGGVNSASYDSGPNGIHPMTLEMGTGDATFSRNGSFNDVRIRSDRRLKSNFEMIDSPLEKVLTLTGLTFDKFGCDYREAGLIAQDVQAVLPEAVSSFKTTDGSEFLTLSSSGVNALVIEAIKELNTKIEQLQTRINQLEGRG